MILGFMFSKYQKIINVIFVLFVYFTLHLIFSVLSNSNIPTDSSYVYKYLPQILFPLIALVAKSKNFSWNHLEYSLIIKKFILIVSGILLWEHLFLDYNFYTNSNLVLEKISLLFFFILLFFNPIYLCLFLLQNFIIWQSNQSVLGSFHLTDIRPVYETLTLFLSFLVINRFRGVHSSIFILLGLSLHASNYFIPGISKIEISPNGWEWVFLNQLSNLFISSYVNGWLGFLSEKTILSTAEIINKTEFIMSFASVFIEIGSIFLLIKKRISYLMFIGFQFLHLGIFFASGIFFWSWIILNFGFLFLLHKLSKEGLDVLYTRQNFKIFLILVFLSPLIYQPSALGWWDTRLNTVYDFIATKESGETIKLNRNDFAPYDIIFAQNRFYYTSDEKTLNSTYGVIQRDQKKYTKSFYTIFNNVIKPLSGRKPKIYKNDSFIIFNELEQAKDLSEIRKLIDIYGVNSYDGNLKSKLEHFIKTYIKNLNNTNKKNSWFNKLGAPYHIYDLSENRLHGDEDIVNIKIYKTNIWWNKDKNEIVRFGKQLISDIYVEEN